MRSFGTLEWTICPAVGLAPFLSLSPHSCSNPSSYTAFDTWLQRSLMTAMPFAHLPHSSLSYLSFSVEPSYPCLFFNGA